jgi:hypothetical protein
MARVNAGTAFGSPSDARGRGYSSSRILRIIAACALGAVAGSSGGCREATAPAPPPPEVDIAKPIVRVTEWDDTRAVWRRSIVKSAARQRYPIRFTSGGPDRQEG